MVITIRSYFRCLCALLPLLAMLSCQKELCYDHTHGGQVLRIEFDWGWQTPDDVKGMTVLLYPEAGGAPVRYDLAGRSGGVVNITSGRYKALCVNADDRLLLTGTDSWETVAVTTAETEALTRSYFRDTRTAIPRARSAEGETVRQEPPQLYTDKLLTVDIRAVEGVQVIRFTPVMPLGVLHVRVENVVNAAFVEAVSGTVSGLSSSMSLTGLEPSGDHCTVPVSLHLSDDGALEGTLYFFGHCPSDEDLSHMLTIYTMLIDGSKQYTTFDITTQMHGAEDPLHLEALIQELPLPKPQPIDGGFDPSLDQWEVNPIDTDL